MAAASPIRIDAFLADSVQSSDGLLDAQRAGWNRLSLRSVPGSIGRIGLALLLRVPDRHAADRHAVAVRLEGPGGDRVALADGLTELAGDLHLHEMNGDSSGERIVPLAINVDAVVLERAGRYRFVVAIDGDDVKIVPFEVRVAAAA